MTEQEAKDMMEKIQSIMASTAEDTELKTRLAVSNMITDEIEKKVHSAEFMLGLRWVLLQVLTLRNNA